MYFCDNWNYIQYRALANFLPFLFIYTKQIQSIISFNYVHAVIVIIIFIKSVGIDIFTHLPYIITFLFFFFYPDTNYTFSYANVNWEKYFYGISLPLNPFFYYYILLTPIHLYKIQQSLHTYIQIHIHLSMIE